VSRPMEYRPPASGTRRSVATRGSGAAFRARASMEGRKRFVTTPVRREQRLQLERCRAAPRCALNRCADTLQLALVLVGEGRAIAPWRREPSRRCCLASAREARAASGGRSRFAHRTEVWSCSRPVPARTGGGCRAPGRIDGTHRPVRREDETAIRAFLDGVLPESIGFRFFDAATFDRGSVIPCS